jgi:ABC-type nickel/cobalt efflux system permease component RcnA
VLLAAIAQHQLALGLLMIVVFSLGLAATLSMLGLLVVYAGRVSARLDFSGRLTAALPAISALVIVGAGCLLTARAVPELT